MNKELKVKITPESGQLLRMGECESRALERGSRL